MPKQQPGKSEQSVQTPKEFIQAVTQLLNIDRFYRDLAADADNTVNPVWFFTKADDALTKSWQGFDGFQWLNPPFAKVAPWVQKCWYESRKGAQIAVLIPAAPGTNWWKDWVDGKAQVYFLGQRVTFVGHKSPYPKDLALLLYRPNVTGGYSIFNWKP